MAAQRSARNSAAISLSVQVVPLPQPAVCAGGGTCGRAARRSRQHAKTSQPSRRTSPLTTSSSSAAARPSAGRASCAARRTAPSRFPCCARWPSTRAPTCRPTCGRSYSTSRCALRLSLLLLLLLHSKACVFSPPNVRAILLDQPVRFSSCLVSTGAPWFNPANVRAILLDQPVRLCLLPCVYRRPLAHPGRCAGHPARPAGAPLPLVGASLLPPSLLLLQSPCRPPCFHLSCCCSRPAGAPRLCRCSL